MAVRRFSLATLAADTSRGQLCQGDFSAVDIIPANNPNEKTKSRASQQRLVAKILPRVENPVRDSVSCCSPSQAIRTKIYTASSPPPPKKRSSQRRQQRCLVHQVRARARWRSCPEAPSTAASSSTMTRTFSSPASGPTRGPSSRTACNGALPET